jgi:hypothetical protein
MAPAVAPSRHFVEKMTVQPKVFRAPSCVVYLILSMMTCLPLPQNELLSVLSRALRHGRQACQGKPCEGFTRRKGSMKLPSSHLEPPPANIWSSYQGMLCLLRRSHGLEHGRKIRENQGERRTEYQALTVQSICLRKFYGTNTGV